MTKIKDKIESFVGKPIDDICNNGFTSHRLNHCAHFVSHALGLTFPYTCAHQTGGNAPRANLRVHEIFAQCSKVARYNQENTAHPLLIFVTREKNVNLATGKMGNIPQKHIGILLERQVYHYSNSQEKVVRWSPQKFHDTFERIYSGKQGLYVGDVPGFNLELDVKEDADSTTATLAFKLEQDGRDWFATAQSGPHQEKFFVGREINKKGAKKSQSWHGLFVPVSRYHGQRYDPADYESAIDHWAYVIDATAHCESKGFMNLVNTYDRAKFTFGFYQLAAHTPQDNLILLFRELISLGKAKDYFPELEIHNGALHRVDGDGSRSNLETIFEKNLQFFMNYLNPRRFKMDPQEILHAARLIHWTMHDPKCREIQVRIAAEIVQQKMSQRYHPWYNLDGASDSICTIIADIHHHGRASKTTVRKALAQADPESALLNINHTKYKSRNERLALRIQHMKAAGKLGTKVYDAALNEFG